MNTYRSIIICLFIGLGLIGTLPAHADTGTIGGGQVYEIPDWFKLSFLDIKEDASEAGQGQKGVMLYMHLDGCPYCARMLDENFRHGPGKQYIEKNFDVIAINILGGRPVTWSDGKSYSEKQLAGLLGVHFTPTIVFLDQHSKKILQINGYRTPRTFRLAMDFVRAGAYKNLSLAQYIEKQSKHSVYQFMDDPHFSKVNYFTGYKKPLAIVFEDKDCDDCADFHSKVLHSPDVVEELAPYLVVRLDAYSDAKLIDLHGNKTTPRQWAKTLGLSYRPGVILFNEGKEQYRIDGRLYHFHFKEALRYVSHKEYQEYASYNSYLTARQAELVSQGEHIDLAE